MPYLDAALAFALTMLAVATLVTQIVSLLQNLAKTRSTVMREMLEDYFNNEMKPVVTRELNRLEGQVKDTITAEMSKQIDKIKVDKLAKRMSEQVENLAEITKTVKNQADALNFVEMPEEKQEEDEKTSPPNNFVKKISELLHRLAAILRSEKVTKIKVNSLFSEDDLKNLVDVSTEEIIEQLKRSDMGQTLLKELGDKANTVFDELGKQYDLVGKKFTKSFREHARWWATGVALALALILNIDTIHIAQTYISNEGMRQAVITQKESLEEGYTTVAAKFDEDQMKESITRDEFEAAFADTKEQLDIFTSAGFPIGWSYFPHSALQENKLQIVASRLALVSKTGSSEVELPKEFQGRNNTPGWWLWVAGCVLTGLLAGLGGPFWYDLVAGISHAAKTVRGQKN